MKLNAIYTVGADVDTICQTTVLTSEVYSCPAERIAYEYDVPVSDVRILSLTVA